MKEPVKNLSQLRVGLLLCDDVDEAAQAEYGTYSQMFSDGIAAQDRALELIPMRCHQGEMPSSPDDYDAFLISGSRHAAYHALPWIAQLQGFVRRCHAARKKTVGICFGHQLIAHALGGEARKAEAGWGVGIHTARITQPRMWMENSRLSAPHRYNLVVIHQDQVTALPPGFTAIAENDFCPISMLVNEDETMLGIQGHPEFNKSFCAFRVDCRQALLGDETHGQAHASLRQLQLDSAQVLGWIARFIRA